MNLFCALLYAATITVMTYGTHPVTLFRLYTDYDSDPPESVQSAMREELESIMAPIGWQISWSTANRIRLGETSRSVAIAHFSGICDVAESSEAARMDSVLGTTDVRNGEVLPFSKIDCGALSGFIGRELGGVKQDDRRPAFGRALGRVLAHELYHVLTNEQGHGRRGVGEARFTPKELTADKFRFAAPEVRKLRSNLVPVQLSAEEPAPDEKREVSVFISSGCAGCHGRRGEGTRWGPSLQHTGRNYDPARLRRQLSDTGTVMYSVAKQLNIRWPRLNSTEIELLSSYMNRLRK